MSDEFTGFPKAGLEFLAELGTRDKVWFDENRTTYAEHVVAPTKAFVTPDQVAALALFLCRDEAASITGANLSVDGGWTAA